MLSGSKGRRGKSNAIVVQTLEHFLKYCAVFDAAKEGDDSSLTLDLMSEYELGPAPWSMFYETLEMRRPSNKAALLKLIYPEGKGLEIANANTLQGKGTYVVDFCAVIQSVKPEAEMTFGQFIDRCVKVCAQRAVYANCSKLGIICDQYWRASTKGSTRVHRGDDQQQGVDASMVLDAVVADAMLPKSNFAAFLKSGKNKKELLALLPDRVGKAVGSAVVELRSKGGGEIDTVHLLADGVGSVCTLLDDVASEMTPEARLQCQCEEADQGILAYLQFITTNSHSDNIVVSVMDTDVHVAMVKLATQVANGVRLLATVGKGLNQRLVDVHAARAALVAEHGEEFVRALVALHTLSGCDTTSSLFGKGKPTFWKVLVSVAKSEDPRHQEIMRCLQEFGSTSIEGGVGQLKSDAVKAFENFAMLIYGCGDASSLAAIRAACWRAAKSTPATLAPTPRGWLQHVLRAHHQCKVWEVALTGEASPDPDGWGWRKLRDGTLEPVPFAGEQAPPQLLTKVQCGCGKKSAAAKICVSSSCRCWKAKPARHRCTVLCGCDPQRCQNFEVRADQSEVEAEVRATGATPFAAAGTGLEHEGEDGLLCEECNLAVGEEFEGCWICVGCQDDVLVC